MVHLMIWLKQKQSKKQQKTQQKQKAKKKNSNKQSNKIQKNPLTIKTILIERTLFVFVSK
jgi:quinol-cytochrome oxidoreductase complex cytochrome b subunit